jgi:hypothetical protein
MRRYSPYSVSNIMIRLLLGGVPTSGYAELLNPKSAPIRISGVAVALALVAAVYAGFLALDGPLAADWLRSALQKANGATVDIGSAELDLEAGAFSVTGLAIADPNALGTDLFRAQRITMDISAADLLRKRVRIDKIEIDGGAHGLARTTPGQLIGPPPEPKPPPETESEKDLDDYLAQAGDWKKRMSQIKTWLDAVSRSGGGDLLTRLREGDSEDGSPEEPEAMTLDEWLDREIQAQGYVHVRAHHLIQGAPTLQVDWIHAPNTTTTLLGGETLDIQARHLSTQPHLVAQGPTLSVQSKDKSIDLALVLDGASARGGANRVKIALSNLPTDELAGQLSANPGPVSGGTVDILVGGSRSRPRPLGQPQPHRQRTGDICFALQGGGRRSPRKSQGLGDPGARQSHRGIDEAGRGRSRRPAQGARRQERNRRTLRSMTSPLPGRAWLRAYSCREVDPGSRLPALPSLP